MRPPPGRSTATGTNGAWATTRPGSPQPAFDYRPPAENERRNRAARRSRTTGVRLPPPSRKRTPERRRTAPGATGVRLPPPSRKRTPERRRTAPGATGVRLPPPGRKRTPERRRTAPGATGVRLPPPSGKGTPVRKGRRQRGSRPGGEVGGGPEAGEGPFDIAGGVGGEALPGGGRPHGDDVEHAVGTDGPQGGVERCPGGGQMPREEHERRRPRRPQDVGPAQRPPQDVGPGQAAPQRREAPGDVEV